MTDQKRDPITKLNVATYVEELVSIMSEGDEHAVLIDLEHNLQLWLVAVKERLARLATDPK